MQQKYLDAQVSLKMDWRKATCKIDGRYVMLDGIPIGEDGHKWWILKVIRKADIRRKKAREMNFKL